MKRVSNVHKTVALQDSLTEHAVKYLAEGSPGEDKCQRMCLMLCALFEDFAYPVPNL